MAQEYGRQIPGQMSFKDMEPAGEPQEGLADGGKITSMPRALRANG